MSLERKIIAGTVVAGTSITTDTIRIESIQIRPSGATWVCKFRDTVNDAVIDLSNNSPAIGMAKAIPAKGLEVDTLTSITNVILTYSKVID